MTHYFSIRSACLLLATGLLSQCHMAHGPPNMGGPTSEERQAKIAAETPGDYYIGRRYHVEKTRFWGYVRKPREPWQSARLVVMREDRQTTPDRLPESPSAQPSHGFDQNYEYKLRGYYTGQSAYDPNSNQILPQFMLTDYRVLDRDPGWLFHPDDHYDPRRFTLYPR